MNNQQARHFYEFGPFRMDSAERLLWREGVPAPLTPKAFDTLLVLVENSGRLVEKEELMKRLWPDTFVEEANLAHNISLLRKTFSHGADDIEYIQTVPRRGYRFVVSVRELWEENAATRAHCSTVELDDSRDHERTGASDAERRATLEASRTVGRTPTRSRLTRAPVKLAAFMTLVILAGVSLSLLLKSKTGMRPLSIIPFTSYSGYESQPAFSPDGARIAFVWDGDSGGNMNIYVKLLDAGTPFRLTSSLAHDSYAALMRDPAGDSCPVWSPDGNYIAFLRRSSKTVLLILIPSLGGPEHTLSEFAPPTFQTGLGKLDWSPDGDFLAVSEQTDSNQSCIFLVPRETGRERKLTTLPAGYVGDMHPAFSPDGKTLAFTRTRHVAVSEIYVMPVAGGEARRLTFDNQTARLPSWTADGREIVFISNRAGSNYSLWRVPISGGEPAPLAGIGDNVGSFAISPQGNRLAYSQDSFDPNIWRITVPASLGQSNEPTRLIASTRVDNNSQYSPDGKNIVFASDRSGSPEIWVCASDGSNPVQLTSFGGHTGTPRWSPDGQYIAFDSRPGGNADIFTVKVTGGQPRSLTTEDSEDIVPSWSTDGRWVYFTSNRSGDCQVWKAPAEGGEARQVTYHGGYGPQPSPDGGFIYYGKNRDREEPIWRVPTEGGTEEIVPGFTKRTHWIRCAITERGIYFINSLENPHQTIEFFDFRTKQNTIVATFDRKIGGAISVSPDGRRIIYTQTDRRNTDIMIAENFR